MKYVLDSAVALKWVLPEIDSDKAKQLRDDYDNQVHEMIAPDILPVEVSHALVRAERKRIIAVGQAAALLVDILTSAPAFFSYLPLLSRATDIASRMRCGVYDCLYVALAEREGCEFVTADIKLVKKLQKAFPFIIELSSLP